MNFLNPFVLFGLAAASIPILLHLLNLRKQKTVEFSSLKFLKELQKSKVRKLKLKQWLLLLLRTLLIIFAVLAFARPTIESTLPGFTNYSNTSMVLLFDNSFSMDVSDENGNRYRQAKNTANSLIDNMREGDQAVLIKLADTDPLRSYSWSGNKEFLKEKLNQIELGTGKAELNTGLKFSSAMLNEAANLNKLVYLVTDMQSNILDGIDTLDIFDKNLSLLTAHIGKDSKKQFENFSIDSISIGSSIIQKDKPIDIEIFVENHSDISRSDNLLSLYYNDNRVAQRTFDISANEKKSLIMSAAYENSGIIEGRVEIENDDLLADNKRFFGVNIPIEPFVYILNDSRNRFLDAILDNMQQINGISGFSYINDISEFNISRNNILIYSKKDADENDFKDLSNLVSKNAKVLLFPPTETLSRISENLNKLGIQSGGIKQYEAVKGKFTDVDKVHPIFAGVFKGETSNNKEVESPEIDVEIPSNNGRSIIKTTAGNFLSEYSIGDGKILYFSVPLNTEWSNFPVTGIFPTLIYKGLTYLNNENAAIKREVEESTIIISKELATSPELKIVDPKGNEVFVRANEVGNNYIISIPESNIFGTYIVYNNSGKEITHFSINPNTEESNLEVADINEYKENLSQTGLNKEHISILEDTEDMSESIKRASVGTELWQIFLVLALLCGITELFVERFMGQKE